MQEAVTAIVSDQRRKIRAVETITWRNARGVIVLRCPAGVRLVIYHQHWQRRDVLDRPARNWAVLWRARAIAYGAGWSSWKRLANGGHPRPRRKRRRALAACNHFPGRRVLVPQRLCAFTSPRVNVDKYHAETRAGCHPAVFRRVLEVRRARPGGYTHLLSTSCSIPRWNECGAVGADGKDCVGAW